MSSTILQFYSVKGWLTFQYALHWKHCSSAYFCHCGTSLPRTNMLHCFWECLCQRTHLRVLLIAYLSSWPTSYKSLRKVSHCGRWVLFWTPLFGLVWNESVEKTIQAECERLDLPSSKMPFLTQENMLVNADATVHNWVSFILTNISEVILPR